MNSSRFAVRIALSVVLLVGLSVPLLVVGIRGALQGGNNDVRQWLPKGFQETRDYDWFLSQFGSEEMAVASWPGCVIGDPRLQQIAAALQPLLDGSEGKPGLPAAQPPLFKRVLTTDQAIAELTDEPMNVPREEAIRRLEGLLVGADGQTAGLMVMVNQQGAVRRQAALAAVYAAAEEAGVSREALRVAGPTADSVALDTESQRSRYLLAAISVSFALFLAWRCLKHMRLVAIVFATAIYAAALNVAVVYWLGGTMNLLLNMMPTLTYLLAMSGAIHLVNYYLDEVRAGRAADAPLRAMKAAFLPCLLSAATTAIGMGSLAFSDVIPVRSFGIYSGLGVLLTLPVLFGFLPAALYVWPVKKTALKSPEVSSSAGPRWADPLARWLANHHVLVVAGFLACMLVTGLGLLRLNTSVKLLNLFSPNSRIIADYTWLERELGPMVPVEIVLHVDRASSLSLLDRLQLVKRVEEQLDQMEKVAGTVSAATFAPPLPAGRSARQVTKRVLFERKLARNRDHFVAMHYLQPVADGELWRVSARVEALNSLDYGRFIDRLRQEIDPLLASATTGSPGQIEATYTGIVPLVYKAQRTLLSDLTSSFLTAFLIIAGVMIVLLRNVRAGLVTMLPNIFPAILLFGAMGLVGRLCDIGSMMTAGVAMGIAVDDTIHFLTWFRRGVAQGLSRHDAICYAYRHAATAMIQSSIICGLGLVVFSFSAFVPTARFAWLMTAMIGTALAGDLILLPALLAGPLGRYFEPKKQAQPSQRVAERQFLPVPAQPVPDLAEH